MMEIRRAYRLRLIAAVAGLGLLLGIANAQSAYPPEVLEEYFECMERHDLAAIKDLLWTHNHIERIDASIYGLPVDDFDDQSLLSVNERIEIRQRKAEDGEEMAVRGSLQYPHHLRPALDAHYKSTGIRFDCSQILASVEGIPPTPEGIGSGWVSDFNLTTADAIDRGEVDLVIDHADPRRILASSCPGSGGAGLEGHSNFIASSSDWGQTWNLTGDGNNSSTRWECDPVSYYQSSTGNVYHSKIGCATGLCGRTYAMMRFSTDNGDTWADCGRPGDGRSNDRQWHVIDNSPTSSCYGTIYITWHNSNQEKIARSINNCESFESVTDLTDTFEAITPDVNVAADGHVYVVWQNQGDATFKIAGSSDCGASWTSPPAKTVKTRLGDWKNNIPAQCQRGVSALPNVDVDRSPDSVFFGRVYMTMFDFDQAGCGSGPGCEDWSNSCDYDIWFTYSDDQGVTWSTPSNLTAAEGDKVDHFLGYMRVDSADGSIYIAYHRTRLNPMTRADRQKTNYFVKRSIDGGATWQTFQASSLEGDETLAGGSTFERGDYNRIDVIDGVAWPVWVDRRETSGEEEIAVRKLCSEPSHWSERAPGFSAPELTLTPAGNSSVEISWEAPDLYWGDGGEDVELRKYQLWVDGTLFRDNIHWTTTSVLFDSVDDINSHAFMVVAVNQCGLSKNYATADPSVLFSDDFESEDATAWSAVIP